MPFVTEAMQELRLHPMNTTSAGDSVSITDGTHVMEPLFHPEIADPGDCGACRTCGVICLTRSAYDALPVFCRAWIDGLIAEGWGAVISPGQPYHEPTIAAR